ncbi:hypothetical protein ASD52_34745 [Ensifer sp. Root142]|uniref:class I SAM-dependent methyltransferase n=1 Tax=Ensifer sp. Root142 TaxID=1736461 RepID=UPI000708BBE5|nr:class I SAM-dependent methyltransferase [Ensifer sp. Root142]KQY65962.1 hypothetical protein ASD52_34745 [Ensifer sp. Root142]
MSNADFFSQLFPADFWPESLNSELVEDPHNMFGDQAVFSWLIKTVQPKDIIEIGSWKGHSANFIVDECKANGLDPRIVCVDTFLGGPEHWVMPDLRSTLHRRLGRPTILERFLGNTLARGNKGNVFPLTIDSRSAIEVFKSFDFKADLIFVDGGHDPDTVINDVIGYFPYLAEDGVMFGDDYQFPPLAKTLHECAEKLGVPVLVSARKWILATPGLMRKVTMPDVQLRNSFDGWIHP